MKGKRLRTMRNDIGEKDVKGMGRRIEKDEEKDGLTIQKMDDPQSQALSLSRRTMVQNRRRNSKNSHLIIHFLTSSRVSERNSEASSVEQGNK